MTEDEKMFHIGMWAFGAVLALTIVLQVCYRTQNKARDRTRREIVTTQQRMAELEANFASYVRPEILRNVVRSLYPKSEVVSFHKSVGIDELPQKDADV